MLGKTKCMQLADCNVLNGFDRITITNNILRNGIYGFKGSGHSDGQDTMDAYLTNYAFSKNLIVDLSSLTNYPANNFKETNINGVGFIDYANLDYRLTKESTYHNAGSDGKDLGPDWNAITETIRGTLSGRRDMGK
jgi:hypothetical protein